LIDVATLDEEYNVFCYQQDFYKAFADVTSRNVLPVIVGGTGMYVDSIIRSYDLIDVPENPSLRKDLEKLSLEELDEKLLSLKPDLHNKSDLNIRERVVRAIEIALFMKSEECEKLRKTLTARPDVRPLVVGTSIDRTSLRKNIKIRLEQRFNDGMLEEVRNLHEKSGFSYERLEKLGLEYRFISEYLEGKISSYEEMFEKLYIAIGQFAKRQETWFRGMEKKGVKINWLPSVEDFNVRFEALCELIKKEANDFKN
ncbi:MAG: tRNA (adenosine(37)-N6)-dimethylallyltransferase MiaA, partial [Treponema sp.]|nr:tRNA (adenosine(37)-N6)-dimethylallyltransferase MiaA [Treponema sp.]